MTEAIGNEYDDGQPETEPEYETETEVKNDDHDGMTGEPWNDQPMERETFDRGDPRRRCTAHRRNGDRCRKWAIKGGTVCPTHGGSAKHVRNAARVRLQNAADRLAKELLRMATNDKVSDAVKLKAITEALDRGGLTTKTNLDIEIGSRPIDAIFDNVATQLEVTSRAAYRRSQGVADYSDAMPALAGSDLDIVDAEVVSEPRSSRVSDRGEAERRRPFYRPPGEPDEPGTGHPDDRRDGGMMPFAEAVERAAEMNRAADARRAQIHGARRALPPGRG